MKTLYVSGYVYKPIGLMTIEVVEKLEVDHKINKLETQCKQRDELIRSLIEAHWKVAGLNKVVTFIDWADELGTFEE